MEHYLAFISYRHIRPDQQISGLLRKHLENWHLPASCPLSGKRRVFRDTDELPTSSDLGSDIDRALSDSDWLIAVCSEEYLTSRWCMREIDVFIESGRKDRILPVLISGTPETAIPPQLQGAAPVLDLREGSGTEGTGDAPGRRLRRDLYEQIPAMMEIMSGTKASEIAASERRFRTAARFGAFAAAAAVLAGLIFYTARTADRIAENNRQIAEATENAVKAEQEALAQRDEAYLGRASLLARKAQAAIDGRDDLKAIRLSMEALPEDPDSGLPVSQKAVSTLRMALVMPDKQRITYHRTDSLEHISNSDSVTDIVIKAASDKAQRDLEQAGYTDFLSDEYSVNAAFGSGLPLVGVLYPSGTAKTMVDGKDFIAVRAWGMKNKEKAFVGWDGKKLAGFRYQDSPLLNVLVPDFTIPLDAEPKKAAFSEDGKEMAVIEGDGSLKLYRYADLKLLVQPEGSYEDCFFYGDCYQLYVLTSEGEVRVLNSITGRVLTEMQAPSPVRKISGELVRGRMLALCEDCVAFLDQEDGDLLSRVPLTGEAVDAEWVEPLDGNQFRVQYGDREELYTLDTAEQLDTRVSVTLATGKTTGGCYHAGYSSDGTWIILEDNEGNLSRWDARTGQMVWLSKSDWIMTTSRRVFSPLSADESVIWRTHEEYRTVELEKVDAGTGERLFRTSWGRKNLDTSRILELPDRDMALVVGKYLDEPPVMFDTRTGELIWAADEVWGYTVLSADAAELISLRAETAEGISYENSGEREAEFIRNELSLVRTVRATETGEVLDRQVLADLGSGITGDTEAWDDSGFLALVEERWVANLQTGEVTEADPEALGLFLAAKKTLRTACTFEGLEAYVETADKITRLVSAADGTVLLDAGNRKLEVSPDGQSAVLYSKDFSPVLIWAADAEALMEEGRKRLAEVQ